MRKYFWLFVGGMVTGAVATGLILEHKDKVKPLAAGLLAKAMRLREKAMTCAARHINKTEPEE